MTKYVIGKATGTPAFTIVNQIPFTGSRDKRYSVLRRGVYDTYKEAKQACIEAKEHNPVGFVVLILEDRLRD